MSIFRNPMKSALQTYVCVFIAIFGSYLFLRQMWIIHDLWTPVGLVDTWPLYDRLLKLNTGQLRLDHYLLDPHGHPHFMVFFLYLIDVMWGSGRQLVPHIATMLSIIGTIALFWFIAWNVASNRPGVNLRSCAYFFGALFLLSGLSQSTLIPFQTVVITSRFAYFLLLALLVICQFRHNVMLHALALVVSMGAVSFYAEGGIFAAEIILLHLLFFRRWGWLVASFLPLAAYLLWAAYYDPGNDAETLTMKAIIYGMNFATLARIAVGSVFYYATTIMQGWPMPLGFGFGISEITLFAISLFIYLTTAVWSAYILLSLLVRTWRNNHRYDGYQIASCLMALVILSVVVSSLSAALLWVARTKIFGAAMAMPAHFAVLTSDRYQAYSGLAFLVFLFIAMTLKQRVIGTVASLVVFSIVGYTGFNSTKGQKLANEKNYYRDGLEYAATALLMGMSPIDPDASAVWPGVAADWYWPTELPKTAQYLRDSNLSYAWGLPRLGQGRLSTWRTTMIAGYETPPVAEHHDICRLNGNATPISTDSWYAPQRFFVVTVGSGEVVGYALHEGSVVKGHVLCAAVDNKQALYVSAPE